MLNTLTRREAGVFSLAALLTGCSSTGGTGTVTLAMAKAYGDAMIAALTAAAQAYLASPVATQKDMVVSVVTSLQTAKTALDALTPASDPRAVVQEVLAAAQQLMPLVSPFLGAASPYASLAIIVLQAFIALVPLPSDTPAEPPAPLVNAPSAIRANHPAAFRRR